MALFAMCLRGLKEIFAIFLCSLKREIFIHSSFSFTNTVISTGAVSGARALECDNPGGCGLEQKDECGSESRRQGQTSSVGCIFHKAWIMRGRRCDPSEACVPRFSCLAPAFFRLLGLTYCISPHQCASSSRLF